MLNRYSLPVFSLLALGMAAHGQTTVADEIGDLSFSYQAGSSQVSSSATSLSIQTSKNSFASADFSSAYDLGVGDSITVSFSMALDAVFTDTFSSFDFGFVDSTIAGSVGVPDLGYDYAVQFDPVDTSNGIGFREGDDNNLGKFDTSSGFGTNTNTFTFSILRTGADTCDITGDSNISSVARTVGNDVTPLQTTSFDRFYLAFRGSGWNEDLGSGTAVATLSDFSITTTVPEPSAYALLSGLLGLSYVMLRRRIS